MARSSPSTRLGSAAADAGSNAALKHAIAASNGYTNHHVLSVCVNRNPTHRTARPISAVTITRLRSSRSARIPITGDTKKYVRS